MEPEKNNNLIKGPWAEIEEVRYIPPPSIFKRAMQLLYKKVKQIKYAIENFLWQ